MTIKLKIPAYRRGSYFRLSAQFLNHFNIAPGFRAAIHLGEVTTGEIGALKKEIVFTGDVLNTAARIQGKCNEFEAELLISEDLKERLDMQQFFDFHHHFSLS